MVEARFKHLHAQSTQSLIDKIITIGPHQYNQLVCQVKQMFIDVETVESSFLEDIFAYGAAELYMRVKEKMKIVAELEDD